MAAGGVRVSFLPGCSSCWASNVPASGPILTYTLATLKDSVGAKTMVGIRENLEGGREEVDVPKPHYMHL